MAGELAALQRLPPEKIMDKDHVCQCRTCHPERFPTIPESYGAPYITMYWYARQIGAAAIAFVRHSSGAVFFDGHPSYLYHVEHDGSLMTWPATARDVCIVEALSGMFGWYVYDQHHSYGRKWWREHCSCGSKLPCTMVEYGHVKLWCDNFMKLHDGSEVTEFDTPQTPMVM